MRPQIWPKPRAVKNELRGAAVSRRAASQVLHIPTADNTLILITNKIARRSARGALRAVF